MEPAVRSSAQLDEEAGVKQQRCSAQSDDVQRRGTACAHAGCMALSMQRMPMGRTALVMGQACAVGDCKRLLDEDICYGVVL